jgi:hypothetical protein
MFSYSKGKTKYDNLPVQCSAPSFKELASDILQSVSPEKGQTYICAAVSVGLHSDQGKHPNRIDHWRQQKLAEPRKFLAFDFDGFQTPDVWEELREKFPWKGFFYTTASHTHDAPRSRAFVELSREVDHDEGVELGEAAQAYLESKITTGWIQFDDSVYRSTQPVYTPVKGFEYYLVKGPVLDVDYTLLWHKGTKAFQVVNRIQADPRPLSALGALLAPIPEISSPIPDGHRNRSMLAAAGRYRKQGLTQSVIEKLLLEDNERWCEPPLDEEEMLSIAGRYAHQTQSQEETGSIFTQDQPNANDEDDDSQLEAISSSASPYTFLTTEQLQSLPKTTWRVKGLFPEHGLGSIYGPSGSGKSFLALDLMAAVACGSAFYGHKTTQCPVVYVALEGTGGIAKRVEAYETHHMIKLPPTFRIVTDMLSLFSSEASVFAEAVIEAGLNEGVIVIDTLAQSAPGSDENSSAHMGLIISNAQLLQRMTNGLVVLIHHTGKDASRGARGHSSLYAALDAALEVKRTPNGLEWLSGKVKDGESGNATPFRLERVVLGKDEDGDEISSCVAVGDLLRKPTLTQPSGKNQKAVLDALLLKFGAGTTIATNEALDIAKASLPNQTKNTTQRAKEALQGLLEIGRLVLNGDKYALV